MAHRKHLILLGIFLLASCSNKVQRIATLKNDLTDYEIITDRGNCKIYSDEIDPITAVRKTDMKAERILSFTHPRLKKFFTEGPFIICDAFVSRINKNQYILNLSFQIQIGKLNQNYSGLADNSILSINLVNGEKVILSNLIEDTGLPDGNGRLVFNALYPIKKSYLNTLRKYEIAELGVEWKAGYETYPVHDIDLIMRQLNCFLSLGK
jgi:hypothetical protein